MATWHCPVCGLDFAFHSELDWHIRDSHCLKRTAGLAGQLEREAVLSWGSLRRLQSASEHPSVSLFMWTAPGAVMAPSDAANLRQLADRAARRLASELEGAALEHMKGRLDEAVRAASSSPTDHGLAVFVSSGETVIVPLPFAPQEKVAVNPSFATRDLLEALQEHPMYRALVLWGPGFRLLEGWGDRLSEVRNWQVPNPSLTGPRYAKGTREEAARWTPHQRRQAALAAADLAIGDRVAIDGRLPLVVVGRTSLLARFRKGSAHAASIVGEVTTWGSMRTRAEVGELAAPLVAVWRKRHAADYLDALDQAERQGRVVWGLDKVWDAVREQRVHWLWVERGYSLPGRAVDGGRRLLLGEQAAHDRKPGLAEDVVDLLIERATLAGAHVEIVENLRGPGHEEDRIAAQVGPVPANQPVEVQPAQEVPAGPTSRAVA